MEIVVIVIMMMVGVSFMLKLSCHGWAGRLVLALLAAAFIILTYDAAASQSKTQIKEWLGEPELMLDMSVLLTIDVAFQICYCVLGARALHDTLPKTQAMLLQVTLWVPGLLVFPTLFAMLTMLIFTFTGTDFAAIAWGLAGITLVGMPLGAALTKLLIPEPEIRLEMIFMVNLLIAALGIVATVNGRTASAGTSEVEWGALAGIVIILLAGLGAGLVLNRYLTQKKITKLK